MESPEQMIDDSGHDDQVLTLETQTDDILPPTQEINLNTDMVLAKNQIQTEYSVPVESQVQFQTEYSTPVENQDQIQSEYITTVDENQSLTVEHDSIYTTASDHAPEPNIIYVLEDGTQLTQQDLIARGINIIHVDQDPNEEHGEHDSVSYMMEETNQPEQTDVEPIMQVDDPANSSQVPHVVYTDASEVHEGILHESHIQEDQIQYIYEGEPTDQVHDGTVYQEQVTVTEPDSIQYVHEPLVSAAGVEQVTVTEPDSIQYVHEPLVSAAGVEQVTVTEPDSIQYVHEPLVSTAGVTNEGVPQIAALEETNEGVVQIAASGETNEGVMQIATPGETNEGVMQIATAGEIDEGVMQIASSGEMHEGVMQVEHSEEPNLQGSPQSSAPSEAREEHVEEQQVSQDQIDEGPTQIEQSEVSNHKERDQDTVPAQTGNAPLPVEHVDSNQTEGDTLPIEQSDKSSNENNDQDSIPDQIVNEKVQEQQGNSQIPNPEDQISQQNSDAEMDQAVARTPQDQNVQAESLGSDHNLQNAASSSDNSNQHVEPEIEQNIAENIDQPIVETAEYPIVHTESLDPNHSGQVIYQTAALDDHAEGGEVMEDVDPQDESSQSSGVEQIQIVSVTSIAGSDHQFDEQTDDNSASVEMSESSGNIESSDPTQVTLKSIDNVKPSAEVNEAAALDQFMGVEQQNGDVINRMGTEEPSPPDSELSQNSDRKLPYICPQCGKGFSTPGVFKMHAYTHRVYLGDKMHVCKICGKAYAKAASLAVHMSMHTDEGTPVPEQLSVANNTGEIIWIPKGFVDPQQGTVTITPPASKQKKGGVVSQDEIAAVPAADTPDREPPAQKQGKDDIDPGDMKETAELIQADSTESRKQDQSGTSYKAFKCTDCGRGFATAGVYKMHLSTHTHSTTDKTYDCPECLKRFIKSASLESHMKMHPGKNPYKCSRCPATFKKISILNLHVLTHENKSTHICQECKMGFGKIVDLQKHLLTHKGDKSVKCEDCGRVFANAAGLSSHAKTHSKAKCPDCGKLFANPEAIPTHRLTHRNNQKNKCAQCGEVFFQVAELWEHQKIHALENDKSYYCFECDLSFTNSNLLSKHKLKHSKEKSKFVAGEGICPVCDECFPRTSDLHAHLLTHSSQPYACDKCDRAFARSHDLKVHKLIHTGTNTYSCPDCDISFRQINDLRRHRATVHGSHHKFECYQCSRGFISEKNLKVHQLTHEAIKAFKCKICKRGFLQASSFKAHMESHSDVNHDCTECYRAFNTSHGLRYHWRTAHKGMNQYKCSDEDCDKSFNSFNLLRIHERQHLGDRSFKCKNCEATFPDFFSLKIHKRVHYSDRPHQCLECNKTFMSLINLQWHKKTHSVVRFCLCHECGKSFSKLSKLRIHSLQHSGERPHKCEVCNKGFVTKGRLKKHSIIHMKNKPHLCSDCGLSFSDSARLKVHQLTHTGERPFVCDICGSGFKEASGLRSHKSRHSNHTAQHPCSECDKCFLTMGKLQAHRLAEHSIRQTSTYKPSKDRNECSDCGRLFSSHAELQAHKNTHVLAKPHVCHLCKKSFALVICLENHKKTHKAGSVNSPSVLRETTNVLQRSGVKSRYQCSACDEIFTNQVEFKAHRMAHETCESFLCADCGESYDNLVDFEDHRLVCEKKGTGAPIQVPEFSVKIHFCLDCGQGFKNISDFHSHRKTHALEKNHVCKTCGEAFARIGEWRTHSLLHEKSHLCPQCGEGFETIKQLDNHQTIHAAAMGTFCQHCGEGFDDIEEFELHKTLHDYEFECHECGECFAKAADLKKHKRAHNEKSRKRKAEVSEDVKNNKKIKLVSEKDKTSVQKDPNKGPVAPPKEQKMVVIKKKGIIASVKEQTSVQKDNKKGNLAPPKEQKLLQKNKMKEQIVPVKDQQLVKKERVDRIREIIVEVPKSVKMKPKAVLPKKTVKRKFTPEDDVQEDEGIILDIETIPRPKKKIKFDPKDGKPHHCSDCGKGFNRLGALHVHQLTCTWRTIYECPDCEEVFTTRAKFQKHQRAHQEELFECPACEMAFLSDYQLKTHLLNGHGVEVQDEPVEPKKKTSPKVKTPVAAEKNARRHQCNQCEKSFSILKLLKRHQKFHEEENDQTQFQLIPETPTQYQCTQCDRYFYSSANLQRHIGLHARVQGVKQQPTNRYPEKEGPHKCEVCSMVFVHSSSLGRHLKNKANDPDHGKEPSSKFANTRHKPPIKPQKTMLSTRFLHAKKKVTQSTKGKVSSKIIAADKSSKSHKCHHCARHFSTGPGLASHLKTHGNWQRKCKICHRAFIKSEDLKKHMISHKKGTLHKCNKCKKCFSSPGSLLRHEEKLHIGKSDGFASPPKTTQQKTTRSATMVYECPDCQLSFTSVDDFRKHHQTHSQSTTTDSPKSHTSPVERQTPPSSKKCHICHKSFTFKRNLHRHLLVHKNKPFKNKHKASGKDQLPHECQQCKKGFSNYKQLQKHKLTHKKTPNHKCHECGKKFNRLYHLQQHQQTHTKKNMKKSKSLAKMEPQPLSNLKPKFIICLECGEKFQKAESLKKHCRTVHMLVKYICAFCKDEFNNIQDLNSHESVHKRRALKPHKCTECPKKFSHLFYLQQHELTHTGRTMELRLHNFNTMDDIPVVLSNKNRATPQRRSINSKKVGKVPTKNIDNKLKPHACTKCSKSFALRRDLKSHFAMVHERKVTPKCRKCAKVFLSKRNLQRHLSNVHNIK